MPIKCFRRVPGWWLCLVAGAVATLGYMLLPAGGSWHAAGYGLIGSVCIALVLYAVRLHRPQQASTWYTFAAGLGLWLGNSIIDRLTTAQTWTTISGVLAIAGYPPMCWALIGLIRGRARTNDRTALVDAGIVATSLGLLYWIFVVSVTLADDRIALFKRGETLLISVGDIAMLVLISLLVTTPGARTASYRLLLGALLLSMAADLLAAVVPSSSAVSAGPADIALVIANALVAAAALHPSMRRLTIPVAHPPSFVRPRLALLAATIMLAPALSLYLGVTGRIADHWLATGIGGIILFLLVTVRMIGLLQRVESQARRLARLAHHDALTELPNRRQWDDRLPAAMAESAATGQNLIVGMIDLDHFKNYNDTFGHQAGDELLADAAAAWRHNLRDGDLLARYGGEEFALLLPARTMPEATDVMRRLLAATPHGQTFSAGLAQWDTIRSPHEMVQRADELLYASKRGGRARITTDHISDPTRSAAAGPLSRSR